MRKFVTMFIVLMFMMPSLALAKDPVKTGQHPAEPAVKSSTKALTEDTGQEILNELRQIRILLQNQQRQMPPAPQAQKPPQPVSVFVSTDGHVLGNQDAPVTIVEFTDYQCPYCKRFYDTTFGDIKKNYIDTGKVKFVGRNLPLPFHSHAAKAAQAAACAGEQEKYWEMRDTLFKNNQALEPEKLPSYAEGLGLDIAKFKACLSSEDHRDNIKKDTEEANSIGITGTPSFVLGKSSKGKMKGEILVGAQPFAAFEAKIKELLEEKGK